MGNKAPSPVSVRHEGSPIPGHFIIGHGEDGNVSERAAQHIVTEIDDDGTPREYVCIGFEHAATIIAASMVQLENPRNEIDKACAQARLDAICGLLGSLGVITNLPKIRNELCPDCLGLGAPATEILKADVAAMADRFGASPGKHLVNS